jgi:hypothetical protein
MYAAFIVAGIAAFKLKGASGGWFLEGKMKRLSYCFPPSPDFVSGIGRIG